MAALDWSQCPSVGGFPGKRSGAWVSQDTRTPVSVVVCNQQWPILRQYVEKVVVAVDAATPGSYVEVEIAFR